MNFLPLLTLKHLILILHLLQIPKQLPLLPLLLLLELILQLLPLEVLYLHLRIDRVLVLRPLLHLCLFVLGLFVRVVPIKI